jgi:hypothetical protein
VRHISTDIWQIAGRKSSVELVADNTNLPDAVRLAEDFACDGILYRLVENLTGDNQIRLVTILTKMPSHEKGKFIFTTNHFERLDDRLLVQVCKIKFRIEVEKKAEDGAVSVG